MTNCCIFLLQITHRLHLSPTSRFHDPRYAVHPYGMFTLLEIQMAQKHSNTTFSLPECWQQMGWYSTNQSSDIKPRISTPRLLLLSISSLCTQLIVLIVQPKPHLPARCRALHGQTELTGMFRLLLPHSAWLHRAHLAGQQDFHGLAQRGRNNLKICPSGCSQLTLCRQLRLAEGSQ